MRIELCDNLSLLHTLESESIDLIYNDILITKIVDSSCPIEGIVVDFFAGSGTTGVVCRELNRDFILCDNSEAAINMTKKRLNINESR